MLVAYGSKNGGSAGIAEAIGQTLREQGIDADVRPARSVHDVAGYHAVVLGGALYMSRWHADAVRFARRHAGRLRGRPVWLFSSGPLDTSADEHDIPPVRAAGRARLRLRARQHVTFGGRLSEQARGWVARRMVRDGLCGDYRNPDRIRAWARGIAADIHSDEPSPDD
ncbi:flavodoxin [Gandjariella thermophila]|uniref:Flavodoxin n=1 Tax=Gandjariella thermophila TaxID=1931992 RepID=A0A4D4J1V2_9PSEU|nr:flavodoxin [Gandjariella thermophila]